MGIEIIKKADLKRKINQEKVWDSIADYFLNKKGKIKRGLVCPIIREFLMSKKGKVVDLGCGAGWNMIANNNLEYYGVDFSLRSLDLTKQNCKKNKIKCRLFKFRIDKLDKKVFKSEMFDYGLFIGVLHCLESSEERVGALKEFYRILKKDGEGLISVWNSEDKRFREVGKGDIYMSWDLGIMRYYYLFKKKEFLDLLKKVGFRILDFYKPREGARFSKRNWIVRVGK